MTDRCNLTHLETLSGSVRPMRSDDIAEAALLHRLVFADYFLTHMGQRLLEQFYSEFVAGSTNYGFVAISDGKLVGTVVGTVDSGSFYNRLYRRRFPSLALTLAARFVVDPYIRRNLASRMAHIRQAIRSILSRRQQTSQANASPAQVPARLLSIGVHPDQRGSGLAGQLVDRYCESLWEYGWQQVGLSVRPENQRAIAFYEKTGWQRAGASAATVQYARSTRPGSTGGGTP